MNYEIERGDNFVLIKGDFFEIMDELRDNLRGKVGAVITDPPYGRAQYSNKFNKYLIPLSDDKRRKFVEFVSDVLMSRSYAFVCTNCFEYAKYVIDFERRGFELYGDVVIVYGQGAPKKYRLRDSHEHLLIFTRDIRKDVDINSFKNVYHTIRARGINRCHPVEFKNAPYEKIGVTVKPLMLLRKIVRTFTRQNELIVDMFAGSASIGESALLEGRRYLGVEIRDYVFEFALERLRKVERDIKEQRVIFYNYKK
ncbi:MAG: site-specific DNA-methyltransferase [Canidatus Methanoxibalbensis ujae]|nr:site-specific DNA-methyltransferase [Candidatus Methanoxibalbensis ujae]